MNRSWILRLPVLLAVLAALLLGTSGCGGAIQATSWTGLTVVDGRIYVADLQQVQVLTAEDGAPLRAFPENPDENSLGLFYPTPTMGEGYMIVASHFPSGGCGQSANYVLKLDLETGGELWRFDEARGQYVEAGALSGDTFVIGNSDGNVYALDVESEELKWSVPTGHRVWATPLIVRDTVYIGSMDRHLYALNLSDGSERWSFEAGGAFASTPALEDGVLYIGAFDNQVYAIEVETHAERWRFPDEPGDGWFWGNVVVRDGIVYAVDVKGNVYAVDAATGEEVWHKELKVPVRAGPALAEDGKTLFISAEEDALYALDTSDGTKRWSADGLGKGFSTPVVQGDMIYETRIHGPYRVRALKLLEDGDAYKEVWIYPIETEE